MSHVRINGSQLLAAQRSGKLDLHNQSLTMIPKEAWNVVSITCFDISGNRITSIDPEIEGMKNLQMLNAEGNLYLEFLPVELCLLPTLRYINLGDCPKLPRPILDAYNLARSAPMKIGLGYRDARPVLDAIKLYHLDQQEVNTARQENNYHHNDNTSNNNNYNNYVNQKEEVAYNPFNDYTEYENNNHNNTYNNGNYGQETEEDAPFEDEEEEAEYQRYKEAKLREMEANGGYKSAEQQQREAEIRQLEEEYNFMQMQNAKRLDMLRAQQHQEDEYNNHNHHNNHATYDDNPSYNDEPYGNKYDDASHSTTTASHTPVPMSTSNNTPLYNARLQNANLISRPSPFATHEDITLGKQARARVLPPIPVTASHSNANNSRNNMLHNMKSDIFAVNATEHTNTANNYRQHTPRDHLGSVGSGGTSTPQHNRGSLYSNDGSLQYPKTRPSRDHDIFAAPVANTAPSGRQTPVNKYGNYESVTGHGNLTAHQTHVASTSEQYKPQHDRVQSFLHHKPHQATQEAVVPLSRNNAQVKGAAVAQIFNTNAPTNAADVAVSGGVRGITGDGGRKQTSDQYKSHIVVDKMGISVQEDANTQALRRPASGRAMHTKGVSDRSDNHIFLPASPTPKQQPPQQYIYGDINQAISRDTPTHANYANQTYVDNPLYQPVSDTQHRPASSSAQRKGIQSSYEMQFMHYQNPVQAPNNFKQQNDQTHTTSHTLSTGHVTPAVQKAAPLTTNDFNHRVTQQNAKELAKKNRSSNIF